MEEELQVLPDKHLPEQIQQYPSEDQSIPVSTQTTPDVTETQPSPSPHQLYSEISKQPVAPEGIPQELWDALGEEDPPAQPQTIEATIEGDKGTLATITDAIKAFNNGPVAAVNELMDLSYSTGKFVSDVHQAGQNALDNFVATGNLKSSVDVFKEPRHRIRRLSLILKLRQTLLYLG